jgi:hypothetical protein
MGKSMGNLGTELVPIDAAAKQMLERGNALVLGCCLQGSKIEQRL